MNIIEDLYMAFLAADSNPNVQEKFQDFSSVNKDLNSSCLSQYGPSEEFYQLHQNSNGYVLTWSVNPQENVGGRIKINSLEHFLLGLKNDDPGLAQGNDLYDFHLLDLGTDEAHVGVFIRDGKIQDRVYFHSHGEDECYDLALSFANYLSLACLAKGYYYWQKYLIEKIHGQTSIESDNFKTNMPLIFPDFSLEAFDIKFEELRKK